MTETVYPLLVNADDLQKITGCGRMASEALARAAGAKVKIGKKAVYDLKKIQDFLASHKDIRIAT